MQSFATMISSIKECHSVWGEHRMAKTRLGMTQFGGQNLNLKHLLLKINRAQCEAVRGGSRGLWREAAGKLSRGLSS